MAQSVLEKVRTSGKLVIAHRESSIPFSYLHRKKPIGYAIDICQKMAEAVRKKLDLKSLPVNYVLATSSTRLELVMQGKAQMECGSTTNNAERREKVAFAMPHFIAGARLLVRADSTIGNLEDLRGKKLVSTGGSTPLKAVTQANRERQLGINVVEAPDHARAVEMVERGEADAFAMDDVLLYGLVISRPQPQGLKVVGKFLTTEAIAIMIPKGDTEFKKLVDEEMRRLIASNELQPIYDKWFTQPIPPYKTPLSMPASKQLKEFWKYPIDYAPS